MATGLLLVTVGLISRKWKLLSLVLLFAAPWTISCNSPGQYIGVGSFSLLQGIFPTQAQSLPYCRQIIYQLSHKGSPRMLQWVAYPFSRGSSRPRNWTMCPALQVDSVPTELSGKPLISRVQYKWIELYGHYELSGILLLSVIFYLETHQRCLY